MVNTFKVSKGMEKIVQKELLMPSIAEFSLMSESERKARVEEIEMEFVKIDSQSE